MSKSHRTSRHPKRRPAAPPERPQRNNKLFRTLLIYGTVVILAGVPFTLGKYFEFNSPGAFDSGSYVYSAEKILSGAEIGVEEKPSAQLGTLLVNMLGVALFGYNEMGPKLIQMFFQAAALILMFVTMRKLFGRLAAAVGVIVASVYLSAPVIAKFGNVKEQYMIAFMILGVCFFVLYRLKDCRYCAMMSGAFLIWAPLFKPTGLSAVGAIGLFVLAQPLLKHRTWKQMGADVLWLGIGAVVAIAPAYIWMIGWDIDMALPYQVIWDTLASRMVHAGAEEAQSADYISASREAMSFSELAGRVLRYYAILILPIALAILGLLSRLVRFVLSAFSKVKIEPRSYDPFVLLFGVWWILDMVFIWISPRSYEQYYLPLNASAAMLAGYPMALYAERYVRAENKAKWAVIGLFGVIVMFILSGHIFFGIASSPHSGTAYTDPQTGEPERRRGYVQKLRDVQLRNERDYRGSWEQVGDFIRQRSDRGDGMYVWGWYPGIYVAAERLSPAPKAFEGTMHTLTPAQLGERVEEILNAFSKDPPKFIVDTYKVHFPWDRPPLELWLSIRNGVQLLRYVGGLPKDRSQWQRVLLRAYGVGPGDLTKEGFVRADRPAAVARFESAYKAKLAAKWPDEAERFEAMRPFRQYVMENYRIVGAFGQHVLFERQQ